MRIFSVCGGGKYCFSAKRARGVVVNFRLEESAGC